MVASATFCLEAGMFTWSCIATLALRMRVSMSAIGSVIIAVAPLTSSTWSRRDLTGVREVAQADAAQAELPVHGPRPTARRQRV
jgi:hypothetical protein